MKYGTLALLLCLFACPAGAQESESGTKGTLLILERTGKQQAAQLKDLKMLDTVLDDGFTLVDQDGTVMNKAEWLRFVENATSLRYATREEAVRLHGDTAIVTGFYRMVLVTGGKAQAREGRFVDTWQHKNGKWVVIAGLFTPGK